MADGAGGKPLMVSAAGAPAQERGRRIALWGALAFLLAASVLHVFRGYSHRELAGHAWGNDDAYISYRYSRNLAAGYGLVFNPGDAVEGYSNFLYVLLLAPACLVTDGLGVYAVSVVLNLAALSGAFFLFHSRLRETLDPRRALLGAVLFALYPAFWLWTASGMETPFVLLLQLGLWLAVERAADEPTGVRLAWLAAVTALLALIRADGFVAPLLALAYLLFKKRWRAAVFCGAALLATVLVHFSWRGAYYGYLLPNTAYAKVDAPILERVWNASGQLPALLWKQGLGPYFLILLIALGCWSARLKGGARAWREALEFPLFFAFGWLAYWLSVGGDFYSERFLIILVPPAIYFFLKWKTGRLPSWVFPSLVAALLLFQAYAAKTDKRFSYHYAKYDRLIPLGRMLAERHRGETLATCTAGKLPFFSGLRTVDMLGLADEHLAHHAPARPGRLPGHDKHDVEYVLSRRPHLIASSIIKENHRHLEMDYGLTRERYEPAGYRPRYLVYVKRDPPAEAILDVSGKNLEELVRLYEAGYHFMVLERRLAETR